MSKCGKSSTIKSFNKNLGHWEQIKRFELTPEIWSIETGLLTPTLKLKRKVIREHFRELYKKLYKLEPRWAKERTSSTAAQGDHDEENDDDDKRIPLPLFERISMLRIYRFRQAGEFIIYSLFFFSNNLLFFVYALLSLEVYF